MPPELSLPERGAAWADRVPQAWRAPLAQLALCWAGVFLLTMGDWREMAWQWWNASTYNHILLIPPIIFWLVRLRWPELARLRPQAFWPALAGFAVSLLVWALGRAAHVNLVAELGAVMLLQSVVAALLGPKVTAALLFPLAYMLFLVPFGDEIVLPMQLFTARMAVALTHLSGVPAVLSGVLIDTPVGRFEVAQACSGVKFLIAMIALGALVAHLGFRSTSRRAAFMAACCVVPVLANGVRAWGTIFVAQSRGVAFAAGFDHIVYGWIFFAVVMTAMLGVAWRFFDRAADDRLVNLDAIGASPRLERLGRHGMSGWLAALVVLSLIAMAATWGVAWAHPLADGLLAAAGARP